MRGHVEKNAAAFGKEIVNTIRATHPRKAKFQAQIEEDNVRYLRALAQLLRSPSLAGRASDGRPEPSLARPANGGANSEGLRDPDQEPVNLVTQRFEGTLDGRTAAAEFGLTLEEFGLSLLGSPEQKRIFGSLLVKGGTAQRTTFQEQFPEFARRLVALQAAQAAKGRPKLEPAFAGHTGTVNAIAFSADGQRAASGSDDRTVRIWAIPSGKLLAVLEGNNMSEVYAVAFSADGKFLLSAGRDRVLRLWDLGKRKQLRVFQGHTDSVRCVAFTRDGTRALSGSDDRSLRVWDVASGEETAALSGHTAGVTSAVWARDGLRILSGSRDGTLRWWIATSASSKEIFRLEGHAGPVLSVALAPDDKSALSGGNDKTVRVWSLPGRKEIRALGGHDSAVVQVQFQNDDNECVSSGSQHRSQDRAFRRWDLNANKEIGALKASPDDSFGCAAYSPDGRQVLVGGPGGFLRLWNFSASRAP